MSKYVNQETVEKEICGACRMEPICGEKKDCEFFDVLNLIPSADVRPVVRGKWLPDNRPDGGFWVCSNCKFPSEAFAADRLYKFCPNCGAYMMEE